MLTHKFRDFLADEQGGYTAWFLVWFALFMAFGGFAVDIGDAFRVETQLQATADAAALAGVMSLPDKSAAVNQALMVAKNNMPVTMNDQPLNGNVVLPSQVLTGNWDIEAEKFTKDGTPLNAVYVETRRDSTNQNPVAPAFLRILSGFGFEHFNIGTIAVAVGYIPKCMRLNGFVAENKIDITSNNTVNSMCWHANNNIEDKGHDYSIDVGNNNTFSNVVISTPDPNDVVQRPNVCEKNEPLCDIVIPGDLDASEAALIAADPYFFDELIDVNSKYMPDYMYTLVNGVRVLKKPIRKVTNTYSGPYDEYTIYDVNCAAPNKLFTLPTDVVLNHVVIVADCQIHSSSNGTIQASVLASSAVGNGKNPLDNNSINLAKGWTIGSSDWCAPPTGTSSPENVRMYSAAVRKSPFAVAMMFSPACTEMP